MTPSALSSANPEQLRAALSPYLASFGDEDHGLGLVVDADRTLAPEDTGRLVGATFGLNERIRHIFEILGYNEEAFARVSELWGEVDALAYLRAVESTAAGT